MMDIDAFVSQAYRPSAPPGAPPSAPLPSAPPPRRRPEITDDLLDRLRKVESGSDPLAVNKETKAMGPYQFLPETVQMLHRQGIRFNPFDEAQSRDAARAYLSQLVERHGGNIDLALKDYGGFVTKDPSQYIRQVRGTDAAAPAAPAAVPAAEPVTQRDLMNPEAIDAFVLEAYNQPVKPGKVASKVTEFLRGSAALADTLYGVVPSVSGLAGYAGARAMGQTPEQAAEIQQRIAGALERPFGKAFGVTETPEYRGEASQRAMEAIGKFVGESAESISQKTGIPVPEVQYYLELGAGALPFSRTVRREVGLAGQAVGEAAKGVAGAIGEVTPGPVRRAAAAATEAIAPGTIAPRPTLQPRVEPRMPGQPPTAQPPAGQPPAQFGSVGAAATPSSAMIQQALSTATPEFQSLYGSIPIDKVKNTGALLVRLEGDSLPVPVRFTEGQATGNVKLLSEEMNMRGADPRIAQFLQENNQALIDNLPAIRSQAAPDSFATTRFEAAQNIIDAYKQLDVKRNADINAKYEALRTAAGGELAVDAPTLVRNIDQSLKKELLLTDGQGMSPYRELKGLADSGQMTFDQYLALRRNLSRLSAESKDGNVRQAARLMVEQLDTLPLTAETAALKPLADSARQAARERFDALKKDPAYKAAVNETVPADKYFDKFVINGVNKNLNTMIDTFGRDSVPHQNVISGTMNWLSGKALGRGVEGRQNFSAANFEGGLQHLRGNKNFEMIFNPETRGQLEILSRAASRHNFQPRGAYINNSNTFTAWMANRMQQMGDIAGLKFMGGIPAGTMIRQRVQESKTLSRGDRALDPLSGIVEK